MFACMATDSAMLRRGWGKQKEMNKLAKVSRQTYLFGLINRVALSTSSINKSTKVVRSVILLGFCLRGLGDFLCSPAKECKFGISNLY